jgi:hypothetical protein
LTKRKDKEEGDSSPFQQVEIRDNLPKENNNFLKESNYPTLYKTSLFVERTPKRGERVC